jgi:hypothetical protein
VVARLGLLPRERHLLQRLQIPVVVAVATKVLLVLEVPVVPVSLLSVTPSLPAPRRRPVTPLTLLSSSKAQVRVPGLRLRTSRLLMFSWSAVAVAVAPG